MTRFWKT